MRPQGSEWAFRYFDYIKILELNVVILFRPVNTAPQCASKCNSDFGQIKFHFMLHDWWLNQGTSANNK